VDVQPGDVTFGDVAELIGWQVSPHTVEAGNDLTVTLYWKALGTTDKNYSLFLHIYGKEDTRVGQRDSYPGGGTFPTTQWRKGDRFAGQYRVNVGSWAEPGTYQLVVGMYDLYGGYRLQIQGGAAGQENYYVLAEVQVVPAAGDGK
jgi:hypothetical protein